MYIIKVCEYKNNLTFLHKRLETPGRKGFFCATSFLQTYTNGRIMRLILMQRR